MQIPTYNENRIMEPIKTNAFFTDEEHNLGIMFGKRYVGITPGSVKLEDGTICQEIDFCELDEPLDFDHPEKAKERKDIPTVRLIFPDTVSIDTVIHNLKIMRDHARGIEILDSDIFGFNWSIRAQKCFEAAEIKTVRQLVRMQRADLLKFRNFGKRTLTEIDEFLERKYLKFGMDV